MTNACIHPCMDALLVKNMDTCTIRTGTDYLPCTAGDQLSDPSFWTLILVLICAFAADRLVSSSVGIHAGLNAVWCSWECYVGACKGPALGADAIGCTPARHSCSYSWTSGTCILSLIQVLLDSSDLTA